MYYAHDERGIVFGSEIKAILADPERQRAVNEEALFHYLSFLMAPPPMTLFEGINKLAAGTWMKISANGAVETKRWWDALEDVMPIVDKTEDEITLKIISELETAINYRKVGDVPIGVFLSGGVDSSINATLFSREIGRASCRERV